MIRQGIVRDYADLARLGGVSRARITQIMNLLNLPPWKQEELLFLEGGPGRAEVTEREMRAESVRVVWGRPAVRPIPRTGVRPASERFLPPRPASPADNRICSGCASP